MLLAAPISTIPCPAPPVMDVPPLAELPSTTRPLIRMPLDGVGVVAELVQALSLMTAFRSELAATRICGGVGTPADRYLAGGATAGPLTDTPDGIFSVLLIR
jgi:hypothetical protein